LNTVLETTSPPPPTLTKIGNVSKIFCTRFVAFEVGDLTGFGKVATSKLRSTP